MIWGNLYVRCKIQLEVSLNKKEKRVDDATFASDPIFTKGFNSHLPLSLSFLTLHFPISHIIVISPSF